MTKVKCKEKERTKNSRRSKYLPEFKKRQRILLLHNKQTSIIQCSAWFTVNSSNSIKMQWRRTTFFFESLIVLKNCRQLKKYHFVYYNVVIFCVIAFLHHFDILLWSKCNKAPLRVQHSITAHFLLIILCTAVIRVSCRKAWYLLLGEGCKASFMHCCLSLVFLVFL